MIVSLFGALPGTLEASPNPDEAVRLSGNVPAKEENHPVLTLGQAVRLALLRNPLLRADRARIARDAARSIASGELPDPKLVLGEQYFPINFGMGESSLTMTTIGLRQSFLPWGKRALLHKTAFRKEKSDRRRLDDGELLLTRKVRLAWLDLYRDAETKALLEKVQGIWRKAFESALGRYRQGIGPESDVLSAQYQKDNLKDAVDRLNLHRDKALHRLMRLLNVSRPFAISSAPPSMPDPLPESVLLKRLGGHPAIRFLDERATAQRFRARAVKKDKIPALSLEGDYNYFMGPSPITQTPNLFSVVLSFNLPVRPGERQDQESRSEEKKLEILNADEEDRKQRLAEKVRNAEAVYRHLGQRIRLFDRVLMPEARRAVKAALREYAAGELPITRVLSAMNQEETTGLRLLSLNSDRLKTMAELSYLSGSLQGGDHEP